MPRLGAMSTEQAPKRRSYSRRNPMSAALTVAMTEEMRMAIEAEAIAQNLSAADVIREAVADALPRIKERRRKRAGYARRPAG